MVLGTNNFSFQSFPIIVRSRLFNERRVSQFNYDGVSIKTLSSISLDQNIFSFVILNLPISNSSSVFCNAQFALLV